MDSMSKRFWVFAWEFANEPNGGVRDFKVGYDTAEAASAYLVGWLQGHSTGNGYVWDSAARKEVHG